MRTLQTFLLTTALLTGCVGAPSDISAGASQLDEMDPSTAPLEEIGVAEWGSAPVGCEGLLESAPQLTFRLADARGGLVAAVDVDGVIVCVDTVESVQHELDAQGQEERADELGDQFLLAVILPGIPSATSLRAGDPTPQPNLDSRSPTDATSGVHRADPTPQPNADPR